MLSHHHLPSIVPILGNIKVDVDLTYDSDTPVVNRPFVPRVDVDLTYDSNTPVVNRPFVHNPPIILLQHSSVSSDVSQLQDSSDCLDDDEDSIPVGEKRSRNTKMERTGYKKASQTALTKAKKMRRSMQGGPSTVSPTKIGDEASVNSDKASAQSNNKKEMSVLLANVYPWVLQFVRSEGLLCLVDLRTFGDIACPTNLPLLKRIMRLANKFHELVAGKKAVHRRGIIIRCHQQHQWTTLVAVIYRYPDAICNMSSHEMALLIPGVGDKISKIMYAYGLGKASLSKKDFTSTVTECPHEANCLIVTPIIVCKFLKAK